MTEIYHVPSASVTTLDTRRLNIDNRSRTSRLPWRGQFSPELIEYLMDVVCPDSEMYLDPFCGSGTVLYEAIARNRDSIGLEVNPAAWHLAALATITTLSTAEKNDLRRQVQDVISTFVIKRAKFYGANDNSAYLLDAINSDKTNYYIKIILSAVMIVGMKNKHTLDSASLQKGLNIILDVLSEILTRNNKSFSACYLQDARDLSIKSDSVDSIITSPPYINVFNYHQNYRPAVEMLGWKVLDAAKSEIGSNRKNRMNRFFTVTQYCVDMSIFIDESSRVLKSNGDFIIVLGRTSNVLGSSFFNGKIVQSLIEINGGFTPPSVSQRTFTGRYGDKIVEDIFMCKKISRALSDGAAVRQTGQLALKKAMHTVLSRNKPALVQAIELSDSARPSPKFSISKPTYLGEFQDS